MKYLIAAAAALSVLGAPAAMAQPYGYGGQQGYYDQQPYYGQQQPYYGQQQPYRGQAYDDRGYSAPYGYAQPYAGRGYAYGGPAYNGGHDGARAHNYSYRNDRHVRRDRHHVAARARYDRHH